MSTESKFTPESESPLIGRESKEKYVRAKTMRGLPDFIEMKEGRERFGEDKNPIYLMLNLETTCSRGCIKCALRGKGRRKKGTALTLEERQRAIDLAAQTGVREMVIVGMGEPTENFEILMRPTIEAAYSRGLGTIMFSTASHLTREQAEFYRDHDVSFVVSLDSLNPDIYQFLTKSKKPSGAGVTLEDVLKNIAMLRQVYSGTAEDLEGKRVVRIGINTTVSKQNVRELEQIKKFAGDDMMYYANPPMQKGEAGEEENWEILVGDQFDFLQERAREVSETGGHSSLTEGSCGYFNRGISVDVDGEILSCGYASETAHRIGNIREKVTADDLLRSYYAVRAAFEELREKTGSTATCPLRISDEEYKIFVALVAKHGGRSK